MQRLLLSGLVILLLAGCGAGAPTAAPEATATVPATAPSPTTEIAVEPTEEPAATASPATEVSAEPSTPDASEAPVLFAPGVISSDDEHEWRVSFTPDGTTAYFARSEGFFPQSREATIMFSTLEEGVWSPPEVASFSGEFSDIDPFVTPDGSRLFFSSIRPVNGETRDDIDLWMVERSDDGWSEPIHLGLEVNSEVDDLYPSVAADGTLYFASDRSGGEGAWDIYRSTPAGDSYGPADNLGAPVNSSVWEYNPTISADGTLLLFASLTRSGGAGAGDLWVSEATNGRWQTPTSLGAPVNSSADEYHPSLSPDGERLYFVRRSGNGDLYYFDGWR